MRIAYLASKFPPIVGGGETQVFLLASKMSSMGHEVTVVTDERVRDLTLENDKYSFKVKYIQGFEEFCSQGIKFKTCCVELMNLFSKEVFDIIHIHNMVPMFLFSMIRQKVGSKIVFTFHNTPDPPRRILGFFNDYDMDKCFAEYVLMKGDYDLLVAGSKYCLLYTSRCV